MRQQSHRPLSRRRDPLPAEKAARVQERRRVINRLVRTRTRTAVKRAVDAIATEPTEATEIVINAIRSLDRASTKGIIHKNNAARRKSRLAKRLNKATAA
jgi:small subunit ribosomal protein S20